MSTVAQIGTVTQSGRFEELLRVSKAISSARDCHTCERVFASELRRVVTFDYLYVSKFGKDTNALEWHLFEAKGRKGEISEADLPIEETTSGWVHENGQPLVILDWSKETRFPELKVFLEGLGIASTCTLPLTRADRRLGVLELGSSHPNAYPEEEVRFLSLVADQVALAIDAAVNFVASQLAQERLKLLLELTNQLVSTLELRDLLRAISASVRRVMDCDAVGVMLPHSESQHLRVYALDFPESKGFFKEETLIPFEGSHPGEAFLTGKPVVLDRPNPATMSSEEHHRVVSEGVKSGCLMPLISRDRVLGVLALGRLTENAFSQNEIEFLAQVAGQIAIAVENALAYSEIADLRDKLAQEKLYLEDEIRGEMDSEGIVGQSSGLRHVLQLVDTVAPSDSTVLLLGETGTGKELIARAIHDRSRRKERTFVKLNCAAIPTGLLESELFGHEKGAFTGAISQKIGRLDLADKGTLFLDEVGDIPLELQPKLLRALQEREFERLGSTRTKKVDVRLVAATNRDLEKMIADHQFRSDLYYRLNVFPIQIPPLRQRPEDIPLLVRYFTQKYARRMEKQIESIPSGTMKKLTRWHWPGNIRELENLIERAVILTRGTALQVPVSDLDNHIAAKPAAGVRDLHGRDELLRILKETRGRVGGTNGAAARMGVKRTTLISRMKKLGIDARAVS